MKKRFLTLYLLMGLALPGLAANYFVRPGGAGSRNGTDWNNAYALPSDANAQAGDIVWLAGGSYPRFSWSKSGADGNPITVQRALASDQVATAAPGWQASFDSKASFPATIGLNGSNVVIDGRTGDPVHEANSQRGADCGIEITQSGGNGNGLDFSAAGQKNITLRHIHVIGPGIVTQSGNCRNANFSGGGVVTNLTISYCDFGGGGDAGVYVSCSGGVNNCVIEYSSFHDHNAINAAQYHPNELFLGIWNGGTVRYNRLYDVGVMGLFWGYHVTDVAIYGNVFEQGSRNKSSGRGVNFSDPTKDSPCSAKIYCNTFVDLPISGNDTGRGSGGSTGNDSQKMIYQDVRNNLFIHTSNYIGSTGNPRIIDYNYYTDGGNLQNQGAACDQHSIVNGANPVVRYVYMANDNDYHLRSAIGGGVNLGAPYNRDMDGRDRGSGAWDVGAFASGQAPLPTPTPSPTPPGPTPTPTPPGPTPTPTPAPAAKFKVGDRVEATADVNVRETPSGALVGSHPAGEQGMVIAGPTDAVFSGSIVHWYDVGFDTAPSGWVGDDNLALATAGPSPTPTPIPTPTPPPVPTPTPTPGTATYNQWLNSQAEWIRNHPPTPDQ
ncbi:MAG TPA: hypothetical protein VFO40_04900 [Chthoniobacterales bacterium]|nr:hypothetical protein [Chthoniobacterales bacterium]